MSVKPENIAPWGSEYKPVNKITQEEFLSGELETAKSVIDSLRKQLKSLEGDAAVMREALDKIKNATSPVSHLLHSICVNALATNAGKSLLERLEEAEWLIERANLPTRDRTGRPEWWSRRDAFLNPTNKDVM